MDRREDLSKVFDRTWNANHNDVAKRGREKEKVFIDKMFGVKKEKVDKNSYKNSPSNLIKNQRENIDGVCKFQRQLQTNNIIKKWK